MKISLALLTFGFLVFLFALAFEDKESQKILVAIFVASIMTATAPFLIEKKN